MTDILQEFSRRLSSAGLVVDQIKIDGLLHRCQTEGKTNRRDGAYKAFSDPPPTLWWKNWCTDEEGTWCVKTKDEMTVAEREALKQRIRQAREEYEQKQAERYARAVKQAQAIWNNALPVKTHPYLEAKEVPGKALKVTRNERLIVPVMSEDGTIQSLQFIAGDGTKLFLKGGKTKEGFFPIPAEEEHKEGPLLIAEGYATGASLHLATGYAVWVAFNAGNLLSVSKIARKQYPERKIILCADNDVNTEGNPGLTKALEAALAVDAKLTLCPAHEGRSTDFNDLYRWRGDMAVRVTVDTAVPALEVKNPGITCPMPDGYRMRQTGSRAGLYFLKMKETDAGPEETEIRLGPPLFVRGMTRDEHGNAWGLWLEWLDPDKKKHQWAMPLTLLSQQGANWFGTLMDGGWLGDPTKKNVLSGFLTRVRPPSSFRCVPRVGWHGAVFVLPDTTIGNTEEEKTVLQSSFHARMYRTSGTMEEWRELATLASGNSRLVLALSAAFAGPLLYLAGLESGGFNFMGGSSTGKSTALKLAASVWDGSEYVRSWRKTDNALEGVAALHNDTTLILDELGQAAAKTIGEAAYMLTNGHGKSRAGRDGVARLPASWRLLFLSSGEVGLADKLMEIGQRPRAGQSIRLVDIPADAGAEMGIFENLHGYPDPGNLSRQIVELASRSYGHARRAFLRSLVENRLQVQEELRPSLEYFVQQVCPDEADGQVKRVAMRFGICSLAGVLAAHWGIVPWEEKEAVNAATACFQTWLSQRGSVGASEDAAILSAVRLFIEQHGASRFQDISNPTATCINRVGFRQMNEAGKTEYIVLPESFKTEVAKGFSERRAAKVLSDAGWLELGIEGRMKSRRTLPEMGRVRCYVILPAQAE